MFTLPHQIRKVSHPITMMLMFLFYKLKGENCGNFTIQLHQKKYYLKFPVVCRQTTTQRNYYILTITISQAILNRMRLENHSKRYGWSKETSYISQEVLFTKPLQIKMYCQRTLLSVPFKNGVGSIILKRFFSHSIVQPMRSSNFVFKALPSA